MILPTQDYRRTTLQKPEKLHQGMDGFMHGLLGWTRRRARLAKTLAIDAQRISEESKALGTLADRRLRNQLADVQTCFRRQARGYADALPEALTLMTEAAHRTLGLRPYPVQIMGAMALYNGYLTEMATGEGKSLTACLPSVLYAWSGRPFHLVTVNDYLADRDAHEMKPFYTYCGITVSCVAAEMPPPERRSQYEHDVVYTTMKELVADLLRDRLILGQNHHASRRLLRALIQPKVREVEGTVLRGLDAVIVDEADSLLIDEAVTPLIISRGQENEPLVDACETAHILAADLMAGTDYKVNQTYKEIVLTPAGSSKVAERAKMLSGIWGGPARREELVKQSLTAREFYHRDKQYVIQDDKVAIVDEFTGRLMANRTWRHGLHQAVEAKEGLQISDPSETLARLSFQRFFRCFRKLAGMTGTAKEATSEFWNIYQLPVMAIPTNRPTVRKRIPDAVFAEPDQKWNVIVGEIEKWHQTGRPVLVGTRSVQASERLADMLTHRGLEFNLLNAVRHKEEARIVAAAGEKGRITISTNMAGRGTDIKLGRGVAEMGGLHVIATERHESGRIDRQLFGRCARQGDPGSTQAFVSIEDELIQRFVPEPMRKRLAAAVRHHTPGAQQLAVAAVAHAQRSAQRLAYRQRRNVLKMDTWLEDALSFTGPS